MRSDPGLIGASQSALPKVGTHRTDAANGTDTNQATLLPDLMLEPPRIKNFTRRPNSLAPVPESLLAVLSIYLFTPTDSAHEEEMADFRTEIGFMKTVGQHQNVVAMLGCCTLYPPLCLIVEYVPHGDLLRYLRELRKKVR